MKQEITQLLQEAADRLTRKGLFGQTGDSLSMRVPGTDEFVWVTDEQLDPQTVSLSTTDGDSGLHATIYRERADSGALLFGTTTWSQQLAALKLAPPTLFDEPARHIGPVATPVADGDRRGLLKAIGTRSNVAIYGSQFLRIGMTSDRVTFNTELFEKCAMAFVIAHCSGQRIRTVPGWVRYIAGGRLRKDQRRAAESFARGQIPQGMNAY